MTSFNKLRTVSELFADMNVELKRHQKMKLTLILSAFYLSVAHAALFTAKDQVKTLDNASFDKHVLENPYSTSVVSFTADWCGHCRNLVPEYKSAAKSLSGMVNFFNVDCDSDINRPICSRYGVRGFPTVKAFTRGRKAPPKDYNGERKANAISEWAGNQIRNLVTRVSDNEALQPWLDTEKQAPHILVYTNKATTSTLLKALALKYPGAKFGIMKATSRNKDVKKELGLTGELTSPAVFLIRGGSLETTEKYEGSLKFKPLRDWLEDELPESSKTPFETTKKAKKTKSEL
ncbi:hypothetical protein E3Q23_03751 [Wallemia mellicola]|uniref:Thioredoxin-domain-containing protein n=2 Tax=Wallemia mellicola TaxID=1708541 RepID=A0A4T0QJS6_9BASI|nr:hypothetical protein E3Q23_03751 [Wallemia mellicola]TIC08898.1 thioredoxin-domain-containing protein [Wallemia mellicola]TIC24320.1 thioredoxin-domain-containing protein [Wallemia mellicola]TIC25363.1 thioredoxin-domain-containing protein [Wallemia mellicola]TIC62803.1 thioredoxin-domain-containing protein [Wallemia mellicola]